MQRHRRTIRTPEQRTHAPALPMPADVYFSRAWLALMSSTVLGAFLLIWMRKWSVLATSAAALGGLWHYTRHREPARPRVVTQAIHDERIPTGFEGFRIAQISDVHLGQPYSDATLAWTIARVRAAAPELIVITGDIVNDRAALTRVARSLQQLHAPCGVYAIPGNHDYVEDIDDVRAALALCGIRLFRNEGVLLRRGADTLWLAGVDDVWHGARDIPAAVADAPAGTPIVLLAHAPDDIISAAAHPAIVLQLSGHVHGGHIRLPLIGPLAMPRYGRRYTHGYQRVGTVHLSISLGLGGRQARLGNPPELNIYTLHTERSLHEHRDPS